MNESTEKLQQFIQKRGSLIGQIVAALFLLLSLYLIAKLVWLWVDYVQPKSTIAAAPETNDRAVKQTKIDPNKLANYHIFGEANAIEQVVEENVEETKLNLKLLGVYVSEEEELVSAIIQSNGAKQSTYWLGDKLKVRGNVTLHKVEAERVIIKNNGNSEILTLLEKLNQAVIGTKPKNTRTTSSARTIDKRRDSQLSKDLANLKNNISQNPASFLELAKFERIIDAGGQVAGYKISPGKDPRLFAKLGLRRNDVVRSINGTELNEQAFWALQESLQSSSSLEVSIERNGQPITLLVNISDSPKKR